MTDNDTFTVITAANGVQWSWIGSASQGCYPVPSQGWLCPRCKRVNSPSMAQCTCSPGESHWTITTGGTGEAWDWTKPEDGDNSPGKD